MIETAERLDEDVWVLTLPERPSPGVTEEILKSWRETFGAHRRLVVLSEGATIRREAARITVSVRCYGGPLDNALAQIELDGDALPERFGGYVRDRAIDGRYPTVDSYSNPAYRWEPEA